jgi:hypothetical protein
MEQFIYPYSDQYISRLNNIAKKRNELIKNKENDILNTRASGSFSIPIQPGEDEKEGLSLTLSHDLFVARDKY